MDSDQLKIGINVDGSANARISKNPYLIQNKTGSMRYSLTTANRYKEEEKMKKVSKQNYPRVDSILSKAKNDVNSQSIDRNLFRKGVTEILSGLKSDNVLVDTKSEDSKLIDMMDKLPTAFTSIAEIKNLKENPPNFAISESNLKIENSDKLGVIKLNKSKNESELKQNEDESVRKEETSELKESEPIKERVSEGNLSAWHTFKNKGKFRYSLNQPGSCEETSSNTFLDNLKKRRPKEEAKTASVKQNLTKDSQTQIKRKSPVKRTKDEDLNKDEKSTRKYIDEFLLRSHMMKQRTDGIPSNMNFLNKDPLTFSNKELNLKESNLIRTVNIEDESEEDDVINIEGTYNYFMPLMNSNSLSELDYKLPRYLSEFLSKSKEKRIHPQKYQNELLNSLSKNNATFNSLDNLNRYNNNKDYYSKTETKETFNFKQPKLINKESRGGVIDLSTLASNSKIKTAKGYIDRKNVLDTIKSAAITKRYGLHHDFKLLPPHIKSKYNSASANPNLIGGITTIQSWWRNIVMKSNSNAVIFIQKVYRGHLARLRLKEYSVIFNEIGGKLSLLENCLRKRLLSESFESLYSYDKPQVIVCKSVVDYFTSGSLRKIIFSNLVTATKSYAFDFTEKIELIQKRLRGFKEYKLFKLMRTSKKSNKGLLEIFHEGEISIEGVLKKKQVIPGVYIEKKIYSNFMEKKVKNIQNAFAVHMRKPKRVLRLTKISTTIHYYEKEIKTNIFFSHILSIQNQWQINLQMKKQNMEKIKKFKRIFSNSAITKESHCNYHLYKISEICSVYKNYLIWKKKSALVIIRKNILSSLTFSKQIKNSLITDNVNKIIKIFRLKNSEKLRKILIPKNYLLTSRCSFSKKIKSKEFLTKLLIIQKNLKQFIKTNFEQLSLNMMKNIPVIKSKPILNFSEYFEKSTKTQNTEKKILKLQKNIRENQPCNFIKVKSTAQPFRISKKIVSIDSLMKIILIQRKIKKFAHEKNKIPLVITKKQKISSQLITKENVKVIKVERRSRLHSLVVTKKSEYDYSQIFSEKVSKIQKLFKANLKTKIIPITPVIKQITKNYMHTKENISTRFFIFILFIQSQLRRHLKKISLEKSPKRKIILNPLKIIKEITTVNGLLKVIILQKKWKQILLIKQKERLISEPRQKVKTMTPLTITKKISFNKIIQTQKILFLQEKIKRFVERIPRKIFKIAKLLSTGGSNNNNPNTCFFTKNVKTFYHENSIKKMQIFTKKYQAFTRNNFRQKVKLSSQKFTKKIVSFGQVNKIIRLQIKFKRFLAKIRKEKKEAYEAQILNENIPVIKLVDKPSSFCVTKQTVARPVSHTQKIFKFIQNINLKKKIQQQQKPELRLSKPIITSKCEFTKTSILPNYAQKKATLINNRVKLHFESKNEKKNQPRILCKSGNRQAVSFTKESNEKYCIKAIIILKRFVKQYLLTKEEARNKSENIKKIENEALIAYQSQKIKKVLIKGVIITKENKTNYASKCANKINKMAKSSIDLNRMIKPRSVLIIPVKIRKISKERSIEKIITIQRKLRTLLKSIRSRKEAEEASKIKRIIKLSDESISQFTKEQNIGWTYCNRNLAKIQNKFRKFLLHKKDSDCFAFCEPVADPEYNLEMIKEDDLIEEPEINYQFFSEDNLNEKESIKSSQILEEFLTILNDKIIMSARRDVISGIESNYKDFQLRLVVKYINFNYSHFHT